MTPVLESDRRGPILYVRLNRPERLNALDMELMTALAALWRTVADDPALRCVVLTGAGKGFCSGADVSMLEAGREQSDRTARDELAFLPGCHLDVPAIVAVNGVCAGGGLHFVADADIAIAGESATFLDPHVSVGQVSGMEPLELLLVARRDAVARMMLLGKAERLDATAARAAGLVSEIVPSSGLEDRARELAEAIAANSPTAVARSRRLLREPRSRLIDGPLDAAWRCVQEHWTHPDAREGPAAFQERRPPHWADRNP
jgi:enoyl-CoA hydratase/carnithine racemase